MQWLRLVRIRLCTGWQQSKNAKSKAFSHKLPLYCQSEHSFRIARVLALCLCAGVRICLLCMTRRSEITLNLHSPLTQGTLWRRLTSEALKAALTTSSPWLSSSSSLLSRSSSLSFTTCRSDNKSHRLHSVCYSLSPWALFVLLTALHRNIGSNKQQV